VSTVDTVREFFRFLSGREITHLKMASGRSSPAFVRHFDELLREAELWEPVQTDRGLAAWMIKRPISSFRKSDRLPARDLADPSGWRPGTTYGSAGTVTFAKSATKKAIM
jgi:hypothetical protein